MYSLGDVLSFAALESTVHPQYNVLIAALIDMVNYCSDAYRHDLGIEFLLHRHIYSSPTTRLNLSAVDANTLLSAYFPTLYNVDDLRVSDGLHLLRRAQVFVLSSPTQQQYMIVIIKMIFITFLSSSLSSSSSSVYFDWVYDMHFVYRGKT